MMKLPSKSMRLLFTVVVSMAPASAVAGGATSDEIRARRQLIEDANAAYTEGEDAVALRLYLDAYRVHPSPEVLYRIGQIHERTGNLHRAVEAYRVYLGSMPGSPYAARIDAHIDALSAREDAEQPTLTITTEPAGAAIYIDGVREPRNSPATLYVGAGDHRVVVKHPTHGELEDTVSTPPGAAIIKDFVYGEPVRALEPEPTPEEPAEPEPEESLEPDAEPEEPYRPLTIVDISPPVPLNVGAWALVSVGTIVAVTSGIFLSFDSDELPPVLGLGLGMAGVAGGGYLLFFADHAEAYPSVYERAGAPSAPPVRGVQVRVGF